MNRVHAGAYIRLVLSLVALGYQWAYTKKQDLKLKETEMRASQMEVQLEMERRKNEVLEQNKTRVVVVTKPDGTRIETREDTSTKKTTTETDKQTKTETKTEVVETQKEQETRQRMARYSITPEWRGLDPYGLPSGASASARLGTLPLWLEGGWDKKAGAHMGVRFEW
jgi:hypothetical protein